MKESHCSFPDTGEVIENTSLVTCGRDQDIEFPHALANSPLAFPARDAISVESVYGEQDKPLSTALYNEGQAPFSRIKFAYDAPGRLHSVTHYDYDLFTSSDDPTAAERSMLFLTKTLLLLKSATVLGIKGQLHVAVRRVTEGLPLAETFYAYDSADRVSCG